MLKYDNVPAIAVISIVLSAICGCNDPDPMEPEMPEKGIHIRTHSTFGQILTDSVGGVLYFFARDADGNSACIDGCASLWPPYYSSDAAATAEIDADDIGVITRTDGALQSTYKGWPLYYYADDESAGEVNGEGVGGNWVVAKPDYSVMLVRNQLVGGDGTHYMSDLEPGDGLTLYLVDAYGRTLYGFVNDRYNTNNFTNADLSNNGVWPMYESGIQSVPSLVNNADFAEITVHGRTQLTYKGWPLYHFGQDGARGETKGVDFPALGVWPVLNPDAPDATQP